MTKDGDYDPDSNVTVTGVDLSQDVVSWNGGSITVPDATDYSVGDVIGIDPSSSFWYSTDTFTTAASEPREYSIGDIRIPTGEPDVVRDGDPEGLFKRLSRIERALGISQRDTKLEEKYPDLKKQGEEYEAAIDKALVDVRRQLSTATDKYTRVADECEIMDKLNHNNEPPKE